LETGPIKSGARERVQRFAKRRSRYGGWADARQATESLDTTFVKLRVGRGICPIRRFPRKAYVSNDQFQMQIWSGIPRDNRSSKNDDSLCAIWTMCTQP
jgi:hypothetical protein